MRTIPPTLQTRLDSGVTTLCRCWLIVRTDGVTHGFTDHDEDIGLGAVTCRAGSGLTGSEVTQKLGLAVDSSELSGALAGDSLNEADLAAGRYDAATIEIWLVDWSEPALRVLLAKGTLGEVRREGQAFTAEVRGLSERLAQENGRLYTATCSADLGDGRCRIELTNPAFSGAGAVISIEATAAFIAGGLDGFEDGWFTAGRLTFTGGANSGLSVEVKSHSKAGAVRLALWQAMAEPITAGDTFLVTAGCDKRFETCRARFNNAVNFRGFPHIPGNDFVIAHPLPGEPGHNGASRQS
ncbi:MAG TPA: DUF2163 domain-containing protein [Pseudolabrys sp.]|jgi:uncharacterized phage protein (TIGR02218 family)|nr:DUF2163 domain-containing protein [Pseudolabrys sp.]